MKFLQQFKNLKSLNVSLKAHDKLVDLDSFEVRSLFQKLESLAISSSGAEAKEFILAKRL